MPGLDNTTQEVPDVVIRHPKERKSKCSLQPLRDRPDLRFLNAVSGFRFDATGFILLSVDAPVLSPDDAPWPLLILDSTWRLLPQLEALLDGEPRRRALPSGFRTAYPRNSKISPDPIGGLASVEALFLARYIQGRPDISLLEDYYWRDSFLRQFNDL